MLGIKKGLLRTVSGFFPVGSEGWEAGTVDGLTQDGMLCRGGSSFWELETGWREYRRY
jgi:hypothetical protein